MKFIPIIIGLLCLVNLNAQQYTAFNGPTSFMRLNIGGTDYINIDYNSTKGNYTFIYSNLDSKCPWSVVSESGTNIYSKLDLRNADLNNKIYLLSPVLNLVKTKKYSYSQNIFDIVNDGVNPIGATKVILKLLAGKPTTFTTSLMEQSDTLSQISIETTSNSEISADNITPAVSGNYYFALQIDGSDFLSEISNTMSIGFKRNLVTEASITRIIPVNSIPSSCPYPNPTCGEIRFPGFKEDIEIVNGLGMVFIKLNNYQGESIDVSGLKPGVYLVKNKNLMTRFIKR